MEYKVFPHPPLDGWGGATLAGLFVALLWLQWRFPLRRQGFAATSRLVRNLLFAVPAFFVLRLALIPLPLAAAAWASQQNFGLLNLLALPVAANAVVGILLLDYAYYWWHQLTHRWPLLWRFHNVHHTDLDMDVSTATRFHAVELLSTVLWRAPLVALLGLNPWTLLVFELMFETAGQFHHSNWRLPVRVENLLRRVTITPRLHGTHHSIVQNETDSNWGTIFSWWDSLHGTLRADVPQEEITIGVPAYREEKELTLGQLFLLPFRRQRAWQLPDGSAPERDEGGKLRLGGKE